MQQAKKHCTLKFCSYSIHGALMELEHFLYFGYCMDHVITCSTLRTENLTDTQIFNMFDNIKPLLRKTLHKVPNYQVVLMGSVLCLHGMKVGW